MGTAISINLTHGTQTIREQTPAEVAALAATAAANAALEQARYDADAPLREARDLYQTLVAELDQGDTLLLLGNDAGWDALTATQRTTRLRTVALGTIRHEREILDALKQIVLRLVRDA